MAPHRIAHAVLLGGAAAAGPPFPTPVSKATITKMDEVISNHISVYDWPAWSKIMEPFWTKDMIYDSVYGIGKFVGLARWYGELAGMQPSGELVRIRICDFYRMTGERISYNWMMLDLPDILRQAGRRVLPEALIRDDGWFQPPRAMDGVPAPYSPLTPPEMGEASRRVATALLNRDWFEKTNEDSSASWSHDMVFYGPSGIGFAQGIEEYNTHVLGVLRSGFSNRSFSLDVMSCEGAYCAAHGYLHGTHSGCFMGEHATGRAVQLRVALHWHIVGDKAVEGYAMFDTPALFKQFGVELLQRRSAPPRCPPAEALPTVAKKPYSNDCLLHGPDALQPPTKGAPATFLDECAAWVVRSTDAVWSPDNSAEKVNASLEEYFYEHWSSVSSFGKVLHGMDQLKESVWATKRAFPDYKVHVTDVFCVGNDVDGYKSVMPDVLTGTHLGPGPLGPPTGKKVSFGGIAVCYVQKVNGRWQYVSEVVAHDERAMLTQLGITNLTAMEHPSTVAKPHDCRTNRPTWGWRPESEVALV